MLGWQQACMLWLPFLAAISFPVVRQVAGRLMISLPAALLFVLFAVLNAVNFGSLSSQSQTEIFGFPYSYYDNRPGAARWARMGSDRIPGAPPAADVSICPTSLVGNLAAYFIAVTILAWPIAVVEWYMLKRKPMKRTPASGTGVHERPEWAR